MTSYADVVITNAGDELTLTGLSLNDQTELISYIYTLEMVL